MAFALPQEASPFQRLLRAEPDTASKVRVLVGGMGAVQTRSRVLPVIDESKPSLVVTCGFAGGLNPGLKTGDVVFASAPSDPAGLWLETHGARRSKIHLVEQVAATKIDKRRIWSTVGADAVEMESGIIQSHCASAGIRAITVRVISDSSSEDLPFDFSKLARADQTLDPLKLAVAIITNPGKIPSLLRLQTRLTHCAGKLGRLLTELAISEVSKGVRQVKSTC